jgi:alpha-glucoside transport system permease protein
MTSSTTAPAPAPAETPPPGRRPLGRWAGRFGVHAGLLLVCIFWFTPIASIIAGSLRTDPDSLSSGWWQIFSHPLLTGDNYKRAFDTLNAGPSMVNSLLIAVPTTIGTVVISALGAFALSRMRFAGRSAVFLLIVALLVVPPQITLIPLLKLFAGLGIAGTIPVVWIYQIGFTVPFGVFLTRGYMTGLPAEILEAATVDGCNNRQAFVRIVLPLSAPILASVAILQFLWSWNDLLTPLLFLGASNSDAPITLQVAGLVGSNGQGANILSAGAIISIIVPLIIIVGLQKYFVAGITGGAVKG